MILADQKPVSKKTPLPCFGSEMDMTTVTCRGCPHKGGCFETMGRRTRQRIIGEAEFRFVPEAYDTPKDKPTLRYAEHIYGHIYETVFGRTPPSGQSLSSYFPTIEKQRAEVGCSLKIYMMACMLSHADNQARQVDFGHKDVERPFTPSGLANPANRNDVLLLKKICIRQFGTFNVESLERLTDSDCAENDLTRRILNSEILAGSFIIGWKQNNQGWPWKALFAEHELDLDVDWLTIDPTYTDFIRPKKTKKVMRDDGEIVEVPIEVKEPKLTVAQRRVRYAVNHRTGLFKRRKLLALGVFKAREHIMPLAIRRVLSKWHMDPADFEISYEVENSRPLMVWYWLALAIQHVHMIWALEGKPSQFSDFTI